MVDTLARPLIAGWLSLLVACSGVSPYLPTPRAAMNDLVSLSGPIPSRECRFRGVVSDDDCGIVAARSEIGNACAAYIFDFVSRRRGAPDSFGTTGGSLYVVESLPGKACSCIDVVLVERKELGGWSSQSEVHPSSAIGGITLYEYGASKGARMDDFSMRSELFTYQAPVVILNGTEAASDQDLCRSVALRVPAQQAYFVEQ